jgi:hypothetical protein
VTLLARRSGTKAWRAPEILDQIDAFAGTLAGGTGGDRRLRAGISGYSTSMPKDRDQLTPDDPEDAGELRPRRSAAREAAETVSPLTGHGPASHGSDPPATDEVSGTEKDKYK